ncbi:MAG: GAF domain-containing protein [Deltaproteobacteria bacterium]|nr:MAG: GAF domain-containing protein [Deltaproteobacteria bacterium]
MSEIYDIIIKRKNYFCTVLALFAVLTAAFSINNGRALIGRPFPGFSTLRNNLVPVVWMPAWGGFEKGIKFGDIVVAVNGRPMADGDALNEYVASLEPGTSVKYRIDRSGVLRDFTVPVQIFSLKDYLILFPVVVSIGLFFYLMGVVVFFLKPRNPASGAFLFNSVLVGLTLISTGDHSTIHRNNLLLIVMPFIGPSFVILGLYFPELLRFRKTVTAIVLGIAAPIAFLYAYLFNDISRYVVIDTVFLVFMSTCNAVAALIIVRSFYHYTDPITRQKAKMVFYGFCLTLLGSTPFVIGTVILKKMVFFWFIPPALMMIPLGIGYAILINNLFDVDAFITKTASYVLVSAFAVLVLFGTMGLFSFALQNITGQSSQIVSVVSTLIVVAMFRPLRVRVNDTINRRFFRQGYEYRNTIQRAARFLNSIIELEELLNNILDTVVDAIQIEFGSIMLRKKDDRFRVTAERFYSAAPPPSSPSKIREEAGERFIGEAHPLVRYLEESKKALHLTDLETMNIPEDDHARIEALMHESRFVLFIPIIYELKLIGLLGLGAKRSGAWYSSDDIDLISTLMIQTAVSVENARKVEELKKMVELETSYRELKALDELKDNFLSMVSHDLRTPMTGIKGYALILRDMVRDEEQQKYLNIIVQQSERLTRLINDLLDVQRFEDGKMTLELADLDLARLVRESVDAFEGATYEKQLVVERSIPEREIIVSGHRDRLHQVVTNLLSNAFKFSPPDGRIRVCLEVIGDGSKAKVSVSDAGPGIPIELQDRLFEKFQQLQNPLGEKDQGSGLGLALVRQIIEYHNGKVGVNSEPGKGSEFFFFLPVKI